MSRIEHNNECFQRGYFTWHHDPALCGCDCHPENRHVSEGADRG